MIDLTKLDPVFAQKFQALLDKMKSEYKITMVPYYEQAVLWRRSRPTHVIQQAIDKLHQQKCFYLASCLEDTKACVGPHATDALPGYSWHNWGVAVDSYWLENGVCNWNGKGFGYVQFDAMAKSMGLTPGLFKKIFDPGHVQLYNFEVPIKYTPIEVDSIMKERFGNVAQVGKIINKQG